ncbi:MAG: L,D-transpeptidase family protein [Zoogloeaceae bacterium]|nr:L,D-transpeptidase family protein [Zoogloeaceae bacterium]
MTDRPTGRISLGLGIGLGVITVLLLVSCRAAGAEPSASRGFLAEQLRYERVRAAHARKNAALEKTLRQAKIETGDLNILMVAYKAEGMLELYAKSGAASRYRKLQSHEICYVAGKPGPKRHLGDEQVPEGFYHIDRFNPRSHYLLSLGINYPNAADRIKSRGKDPGGDIFIHGDCVSIGCLPMTHDKIQELYLYAVHARNSGQERIPVYIFPFRMTAANMRKYAARNAGNPALIRFWQTLEKGHARFLETGQALLVQVDEKGDYVF